MNKQYSAEEKAQLIRECKDWVARGRSISSFALDTGIPKGTLYGWVQVKNTIKHVPNNTPLVHIPKSQPMNKTIPTSIEMRCGAVSFVFNEGSRQESIEATLLSLKKCGLL